MWYYVKFLLHTLEEGPRLRVHFFAADLQEKLYEVYPIMDQCGKQRLIY